MIAELLPPKVASAEVFTDDPDVRLFPEEEALVAKAVAKRRDEFANARACARRALGELGYPPVPILSGPKREPLWPDGVVGAITHCAGYRAAAVARASDVTTIGVDAEPHAPLPDGVLDAVSLPAERARGRALAVAAPDTHWDRILFCAKETVYKAWFPRTKRWLGFEDADITIDGDGTFDARILIDGSTVDGGTIAGFTGRWIATDGLILTVIAEPSTVDG
ncbi:4'-phosphopantetheinyl transferase EntD [Herbihabitans rhizosphaerae]|uniref:4'-phosphopantetheinyl transferase EntD n=1 Tax=Herbihabitans rhizosphaerae TaxID=1872711 RepID=A0A4Q7KK32_9PSEU|nr:4'-phosphopantetheinyl transferase superfamily protein [Herbihabitans rhizosphaerae]RZS36567.1 4'-phosphopantetheinyl transferase EntD [Herbihabitans rhizosphaerae]